MHSVNRNITKRQPVAIIPLYDVKKDLTLRIIPRSKGTLHQLVDPIKDDTEPEWQLFEGCFYDFELSDPAFTLSDTGRYGIVRPHSSTKHVGQIAPNIYTGTIEIAVLMLNANSSGESVTKGKVHLEIQSLKTGYREDYRTMLEFITEKCTDLVMQSSAPTTHYFEPVYGSEEEIQRALYQRFAFIRSVIDTDEFTEAVHRVVTRPVTRWTETDEPVDIRRVRRFSRNNLREIARAGNRSEVPTSHYLKTHAGVDSVPTRISSSRKTDSHDTAENRFVKHALETFLQFCTEIHEQAGNTTGLRSEAKAVMVRLESHLHHSLFREISRAQTLPLNSPVLQRKEGYREILRSWLMFDLAAKLVWKGGDDVYGGRKKDVATLYEYWLFFQLLDVLESVFNISPNSFDELVEVSAKGLDIKLKQGRHIPLHGVHKNSLRNLNIRFSYNRPFRGSTNFMTSGQVSGEGSWTASMRPDYTLSMWPESLTDIEAESNELIVHIHFDAKYKVENLLGLLPEEDPIAFTGARLDEFQVGGLSWEQISHALIDAGYAKRSKGMQTVLKKQYWLGKDGMLKDFSADQNKLIIDEIESQLLNTEKQQQQKGSYKNADLLKMHAYKDAIRRTAGAYVLYPGVVDGKTPPRYLHRGFHEIIPGLGAFAISPSREVGGKDLLKMFIVEVRDLFVSRISQREKMALHTKEVHKFPLTGRRSKLASAVPEFLEGSGLLDPDNTWVLVGYYPKKNLSWIQQTGLYNFRADTDQRGALKMNSKTAGARYLLLHGKGDSQSSLLYKLNGEGPRVMLRSQLEDLGYPQEASKTGKAYFVFDKLELATDDEFNELVFDLSKLPGFGRAQESGRPLTVSLTELMASIFKKTDKA